MHIPVYRVVFVQASKRYSDRVLRSLEDFRRLRRAVARPHRDAPCPCSYLGGAYRESDALGAGAAARQRGETQWRGEAAGGGHGRQ